MSANTSGGGAMDLIKQLRALIAAVDPAQLTVDDRLALVDLIEKAFAAHATESTG